MSDAGLKGVLYMCAFAVMFALVEALGAAMPAGYSPYEVVWGRYLVHLVLTVLVMLALSKSVTLRGSRWGVQLSRSALMLVMPVAFVHALGEASTGWVWAAVWTAPLMTMAWAGRFGAAPLDRWDWVIALACLAGTMLVLRPALPVPLAGAGLALLAAASLAGYILLTAKLGGDAILTSLLYTAIVPFLALSTVMPEVWKPLSLHAAALVIGIGIVGWCGLLALDRAVRLLDPARVAVFTFVAVIAGPVIARETGHTATLVGAGIIAVALAGAAIRAGRFGLHGFRGGRIESDGLE